MKPAIITDWTPDKARDFTRETLQFRHQLQQRMMFADAGLVDILDRYPRDKLGVFTMGPDPTDWRSWKRGRPGDLSGAELLDAARKGRIWLNLRAVNEHDRDYADLCDEIFADKARFAPQVKTFKRDVGLLISSPNAQVFYHLDVALVSLGQLRGTKTVWIYPPRDPYVGQEDLERIVLKETAEQFAFDPAWDEGARKIVFEPGMMVTWPQNAPHRIVNSDSLNVSLSVEFMTPEALMRANVIYANGKLRRIFGARPGVQAGVHPLALGKLALARMMKATSKQRAPEPLAPTFSLGRGQPLPA
jgi:hypothetical protein